MQVELKYKKILIPIDFSDPSRKAFYIGLKYAKVFDCDTFVLHVTEPGTALDGVSSVEARAEAIDRVINGVRRRVDEVFQDWGMAEVDRRRVHIDIRAGKPWKEILKYADDNQIDLIVIGSHGESSIKDVLLGSTTERVVRKAACHVLCIKPEEAEEKPLEEGTDL